MDCKEMQKYYIPFIDDKLSIKDLDEFLRHIEQCPDCKEEYDIYYTMLMGVRYLENDSAKYRDWVSSEEKLYYAQDYLRKYRIFRMGKLIAFGILCMCYLLLFT